MDFANILSLLQTGSVILAIIVAVGTIRGKSDDKTASLTEMQVDIRYIKQRIDNLDDLRDTAKKAEQSAQSAHDRLDRHLRYEHQKSIERRGEDA